MAADDALQMMMTMQKNHHSSSRNRNKRSDDSSSDDDDDDNLLEMARMLEERKQARCCSRRLTSGTASAAVSSTVPTAVHSDYDDSGEKGQAFEKNCTVTTTGTTTTASQQVRQSEATCKEFLSTATVETPVVCGDLQLHQQPDAADTTIAASLPLLPSDVLLAAVGDNNDGSCIDLTSNDGDEHENDDIADDDRIEFENSGSYSPAASEQATIPFQGAYEDAAIPFQGDAVYAAIVQRMRGRIVWPAGDLELTLNEWLACSLPSQLSSSSHDYDCDWIQVHNANQSSPGFGAAAGGSFCDAPFMPHLDEISAIITRGGRVPRAKKESCIKSLIEVASRQNCTYGKWMLFFQPGPADKYWERIARATVEGRLGCSAKIAPTRGMDSNSQSVLCCAVSTSKTFVVVQKSSAFFSSYSCWGLK